MRCALTISLPGLCLSVTKLKNASLKQIHTVIPLIPKLHESHPTAKRLLNALDEVADLAADGKLRLRFRTRYTIKSVALLNGIEIIPIRQKALAPVRWITADGARLDSQGHLWHPDQFVLGGRRRVHRETISGVADPVLHQTERYGHFTYAIPVAKGSYTLTLYFSEHWFGVPDYSPAGIGDRVFDVYCNGVALLRDFDINKEAGGSLKAITRTFHGLKPNHLGKLILSFVPSADYACLNALEVVDESYKE